MRVDHKKGFIEWEVGTGGNHEITQIRAYEIGKGIGRELLNLYKQYAVPPPRYSVYAFVLANRDGARNFYRKNGFREINLGKSIYEEDQTVLMWIPFSEL